MAWPDTASVNSATATIVIVFMVLLEAGAEPGHADAEFISTG
jgi:hypothetical protein